MTDRLRRRLSAGGVLLADGATGTNLFAMGLQSGDPPEPWCLAHPERVRALHRGFVDAGSDLVLTNSFGGNRHRLKLHRLEGRVAELNTAAARLAREVADSVSAREVVVAGSIGPTGELFAPLGPLDHAAGVAAFAEQAEALAAGGADVIWIETMSAREEVAAAVEGARGTGLPVVCTLSFDTNGRTMMGLTPADLVALCRSLDPRPVAIGTNCGLGASEVVAGILALRAAAGPDAVLVAKANAGIPRFHDGAVRYDGTPELMGTYARLARDAGARIIGGCCGTTAEHLRAMRTALDSTAPEPPPDLEAVVAALGPLSTGALGGHPPSAPRTTGRRRRGRA